MAVNDSTIFAGTFGSGLFRSTDTGATWIHVDSGLTDIIINDLEIYGTGVLAAGPGDIYSSSDNGTTWTPLNTGFGSDINAIAVGGTAIFAGTSFGGVYVSTNGGSSWATFNEGYPFTGIYSLEAGDTYLYVGSLQSGFWRRPLSDVVTGIAEGGRLLPETFRLEQNYPNPFNPTTRIRFVVARTGPVSLRVYDLLGREVATMVDGVLNPGAYERTFDARGLAGGIYFFRLQAGAFTETKKFVLMR
jgi:hypothetical protein